MTQIRKFYDMDYDSNTSSINKNKEVLVVDNGDISGNSYILNPVHVEGKEGDKEEVEYWKSRCFAAEYLISPTAYEELPDAYTKWQKIKHETKYT